MTFTKSNDTRITCYNLKGHNYLQWSQSVMTFMYDHGQENYITGKSTSPKLEDPKFRTWRADLQWSQSVMAFMYDRGQENYITTSPKLEDPKFCTWRAEEHHVMRWLINSMTTDSGENFLLFSTTKEIWDLLETLSPIRLNSSRSRLLSKISNKVFYLLQLTTSLYLDMGNNWAYLKLINGIYSWFYSLSRNCGDKNNFQVPYRSKF